MREPSLAFFRLARRSPRERNVGQTRTRPGTEAIDTSMLARPEPRRVLAAGKELQRVGALKCGKRILRFLRVGIEVFERFSRVAVYS
jgi:hypothetical protein